MYRQQNSNAGSEQQYQFSASNASYNYSPFSGNMSAILDTGFHSSPQHLSPRPLMRAPSHARQQSNDLQGGIKPGSSTLSPRLRSVTPSGSAWFTPTDRSLPSKDVTPETIADAYAAFILYCNPKFQLDVDTTTLKANFQSLPKSDNKDFDIFHLYELLQKFDTKEIKTWGQLALELGVEAPDVSKGQSVQKVQQYSVRLKRWMRAMHVDAFVEYLLGRDHVYFTEIPHPNDPHPPGGRDGVLAEEDLAIRALDPAFRPKRGRRRNSDAEQDADVEVGSTSHPVSMMPFSAHPENSNDPWAIASAVTPQTFAPWGNKQGFPQSAVTAAGPSQLKWQLHGKSQNAATPHPMSAHPTSIVTQVQSSFEDEPRSAITPSARKRRKHGPAVSSAWPSAIGPGAKPRGRPPASRNTQDGPFSTFPADPANEKSSSQVFAAAVAPMDSSNVDEEQSITSLPAQMSRPGDMTGRPSRLSLQVPPHTGGPVRLATPPQVLVNGETDEFDSHSEQQDGGADLQASHAPPQQQVIRFKDREMPGFAFEALKRVFASDLLRAEIVGRKQRLTGEEAKRLADSVLERFNLPRKDTQNSRDDIARLTAASWLGVGEQLNVPLGPATGHNKRILVTRFRIDDDGYEEIVSADDDSPGYLRELFDLSWTVSMGGCNGNFELKGLSLADEPSKEPDIHDNLLKSWSEAARQVGVAEADISRLSQKASEAGRFRNETSVGDERVDWKTRFRALEFGAELAKGEFMRFKNRVIEKLLDVLEDNSL